MGWRELSDDAQHWAFWGGAALAVLAALSAGFYWNWWAYLWHVPPPLRGLIFLAAVVLVFTTWAFLALVLHRYLGWPSAHPFQMPSKDRMDRSSKKPIVRVGDTVTLFTHDVAQVTGRLLTRQVESMFKGAGWQVQYRSTNLPKHATGVWVLGGTTTERAAAVWALQTLEIAAQVDEHEKPPTLQVIIGAYQPVKAEDQLNALRIALDATQKEREAIRG